MKLVTAITGLLLASSALSYEYDINPFSVEAACNTGSQANLAEIIGAGESSKSAGTVALYKRTRNCNSLTGCGQWNEPVQIDSIAASIQAYGSFQVVFDSDAIPNSTLSLGITDPYADGRVNGCRWSKGFEGSDSHCSLYLRNDCLRLATMTVDGTTEYSAFWPL